jgi:Zn-dependent peptidase ImmA (M78 family)/DNA-binding XRE family transcriptional regulator
MADEELFSGERLVLARQRRGMFAQELAARVAVSVKTVSRWERGEKAPSDTHVIKIAETLDFPPNYFRWNAPSVLAPEKFRALARLTQKEQLQARAAGAQAVALDEWISGKFNRPAPDVPDLRDCKTPETAADELRAAWGLGYKALQNTVHLLERHGVRVYSLVHTGDEIDAFSVWQGETPFVFVNTVKSAERGRMDVCHELCHLTRHAHTNGANADRIQEKEAQTFASSLLMPTVPFLKSRPRTPSLAAIIDAKREWGVSALSYVYRLHTLNQISDWTYRSLCIQIKANYPRSEPGPQMPRENSQVLAKVFASGATRKDMVRELRIRMQDFDEMTFGLALTPMAGGLPPGNDIAPMPNSALRLVR